MSSCILNLRVKLEEKIAQIENKLQEINIETTNLMIQSLPEFNIIQGQSYINYSSMGKKFEEYFVEYFKYMFNSCEIINVSQQPHVGDIHIIDHINKILYLVELKYKDRITKEDINKFEDDVDYVNKNHDYEIFGLFISLKTTEELMINKNKIYLSKHYITEDIINAIIISFNKMYSVYKSDLKMFNKEIENVLNQSIDIYKKNVLQLLYEVSLYESQF